MMKLLLAAAAAALVLAFLSRARAAEPRTSGPPPAGAPLGVAPGVVDVQTARRLVAAGVKVVDVRTAGEFAAGHVPGALNIPYDELGRRHAELGPPSTPVVLYCRSGNRSGQASATLRGKGFTLLYDFQRWDAWQRSEPGR